MLEVVILIAAVLLSIPLFNLCKQTLKIKRLEFLESLIDNKIKVQVHRYMGQAAGMKANNDDNKLSNEERRELSNHVVVLALESCLEVFGEDLTEHWTSEDLTAMVAYHVKQAKLEWKMTEDTVISIGGEGPEDDEDWA